MSKFKMTDPTQVEAQRQATQLKNWIQLGDRAGFEAEVQAPGFLRMALTPAVLRWLATNNRDDWWPVVADRVDPGVIAKAAEEMATWETRHLHDAGE